LTKITGWNWRSAVKSSNRGRKWVWWATADYAQRVATVDGATGGTISGNVSIQSDLAVDGNIDATGKATIGPGHTNSGISSFVAGRNNSAQDTASTVCGGQSNIASGRSSTIGGGKLNTASGDRSTVGGGSENISNVSNSTIGGGANNTASGVASTVGGGYNNTASGLESTVAGGLDNTASGNHATVAGGYDNIASDTNSTISGGIGNEATRYGATVGGGRWNRAHGIFSVVSGGGGYNSPDSNAANGDYSVIGGGQANIASAWTATVGGGSYNTASGLGSVVSGGYAGLASGENATIGGGWHNLSSGSVATVAGGQEDTASGIYSAVPGGFRNTASGTYSFAAGNRAKANHVGTFVWGDGTLSDFASTGNNQFLIRASGGVGIGTNNPTSALHVNGEAKCEVGGVEFFMVPRGAIIMWSGLLADIPSGWALCDGNNSTPDLRNRFVYGVINGEDPGATGGNLSHSHQVSIPSSGLGITPIWANALAGTYTTSTKSHIPPFYKLAFIMKL
jgi:hypothetical protein